MVMQQSKSCYVQLCNAGLKYAKLIFKNDVQEELLDEDGGELLSA